MKRLRHFEIVIQIVVLIATTGLAGVGGGMEGPLLQHLPPADDGTGGSSSVTLKGFLVSGGAALAIISTIILILIGRDGSETLELAERHISVTRDAVKEWDNQQLLDTRRVALLSAWQRMQEALEVVASSEKATVESSAQYILDAAKAYLIRSIGLDGDEGWIFSVFQVQQVGDGEKLVLIASSRPRQMDVEAKPRSWEKGEGFVGDAWNTSRDTIISDSTNIKPEDYGMQPGPQWEKDKLRYRSMAAIPIRIGNGKNAPIWGAVAFSSNMLGRFRSARDDTKAQNVDTARTVARMMALLGVFFQQKAG